MRTMIGFCSIAALALLFATGCDRNDRAEVNDAAREAGRETSEAMKEVGQEASEAWNDLKNATWDRRVEYRSTASRELDKLKEQMEDLDDKIEKNAKEGAAELKQQWRSLSDERSALELQIDRLGDATEDGWDKGRDAVGESMSKIRREMNELKRKIG